MKIINSSFRKTITAVVVTGLFGAAPVMAQSQTLQYFKPYDQEGVNMFETPAQNETEFDGFQVRWGANFTQQVQWLDHTAPNIEELPELGFGFNTAAANLNLDAQLADGIRVNVITYLSSRAHPEAWVKGGYLQIDRLSVLNSELIDRLMENVTIRAGHFEVNYGDGHFRRTDNANAMHNPFVGNYVMDAFTTEIGTEVYYQNNGFLAMGAFTNGEIQGRVTDPDDRAPSFYGKLGIDRQINPDLRVRMTGSAYTTSKSSSNTLYFGDRAGSRYYSILDGGPRSGTFNPAMRDNVTAIMVNPFVKLGGLEVFGLIERTSGKSHHEAEDRIINQYSGEVIYRFLDREQLFVGGRYNVVNGELVNLGSDASVDRLQVGGGWFLTPQVLIKAEYVNQNYNDFPTGHDFAGAGFSGFMLEGVVSF